MTTSENELQWEIISTKFPFFRIIWYLKNENVTLSKSNTFCKWFFISNIIYYFVTIPLLSFLNNGYRSVLKTMSGIHDGSFCKEGLRLNTQKNPRKLRIREKWGFLLKGCHIAFVHLWRLPQSLLQKQKEKENILHSMAL